MPATPGPAGLPAEPAFGANLAGDTGDFAGEGIELIDRLRRRNLPAPAGVPTSGVHTLQANMDKTRAQEIAEDAAEQGRKTTNEAAQRVGEQVQPALDQAKSVVQDLSNQASEAGRQATTRAGEFIESVTPQVQS